MSKTIFHVTDARLFDRICDQGLRPSSDRHPEHVYLFDALDAALDYAVRYHFAENNLGNGLSVRAAGQPLLLWINGDGLELEPDPMRPVLPHAWRTPRDVEPERLLASARLAYDGQVARHARPRRIA